MKKRRFIGHIVNGKGVIEGDEYHHLVDVIRGRKGMEIVLVTKDGVVYESVIEKIDRKNRVVLARLNKLLENKETSQNSGVIVAFALFNENRLRFLLEKCTEIGVKGFLPFVSERSKRKGDGIREGWKKVLESAVKQSGRSTFPFIENVCNIVEALERADKLGSIYLLDREGKKVSNVKVNHGNCIIFVGPEGGFTDEEKKLIKNKARGVISLGGNVLRTETAAILGAYEFTKSIKTKGGEALVRSPSA